MGGMSNWEKDHTKMKSATTKIWLLSSLKCLDPSFL